MQSPNFTLTYHQDAGHGWLEVTRKQVVEVGLAPSDFSFFSYKDGGTFYLEEDCDAPHFVDAARNSGIPLNIVSQEHNGHSWIRNLPRL
jgi:hypothetical protein